MLEAVRVKVSERVNAFQTMTPTSVNCCMAAILSPDA
eukprot:gene1739-2080_t